MKRLLLWCLYFALALVALVALALGWFRWQADQREVEKAQAAAPPTGRYVRADDVDMFVQETGPADGIPVLFVHGTGAWSETWRETLAQLAQAGYRVIAIDLPPFGYSGRPGEPRYDKPAQGRRISAAIRSLGLNRPILVGHSFGGGPTVEAALAAPQEVRGLVLVDAALGIVPDGGGHDATPALLGAFLSTETLRDAVVATFLTNPSFTRNLLQAFIYDPVHATDAKVTIYRRPLSVMGTTKAIGSWLPALLAPTAVAPSENPASYRALDLPVMVIWGERDTITPLGQAARLKSLTPRGELHVMKNVGHIPQIEDAATFNAILLQVVRKLERVPDETADKPK